MSPHPAAAVADGIARIRQTQNREAARLGHTPPTLSELRAMADLAAQHQQMFADLELSLPQPGATDRPLDYRVGLLTRLQQFSPTWRDTDLARLARSGGLGGIERAIVEDARRVAADHTVGSFRRPGELREIHRTDAAGQTTTEYRGSPLSWMRSFMCPVVAMVEAFVDPRTGRQLLR